MTMRSILLAIISSTGVAWAQTTPTLSIADFPAEVQRGQTVQLTASNLPATTATAVIVLEPVQLRSAALTVSIDGTGTACFPLSDTGPVAQLRLTAALNADKTRIHFK